MLIPYTDPNLLNSSGSIAESPFTLIFQRAGLAIAASIMNAVILTAVLSAGNSSLYAASRMLWALADRGKAPKFLAKTTRHGVPIHSLLVNVAIGCVAFLSFTQGTENVYSWMLDAASLTGFLAWLGISMSHYRFRRAYVKQGKKLSDLAYKSKFFPYGAWISMALCAIVLFGQDYAAFMEKTINWTGVITTYCGIPIFIMVWLGYKLIKRSKIVPLMECNFERED